MNEKDEQALRAIKQTMQRDKEVRESIERSLENHARDYFAEVVDRVINQLRVTVKDKQLFLNTAYDWFKNRRS